MTSVYQFRHEEHAIASGGTRTHKISPAQLNVVGVHYQLGYGGQRDRGGNRTHISNISLAAGTRSTTPSLLRDDDRKDIILTQDSIVVDGCSGMFAEDN